ncbi:CHASE2 domain-containing protein [Rhizobium sp. G187]|uniref:CHASE2 domain-containing protein n=1 Tax=Rhizobium sp. G187 TaxID=3451352 RepID=UPI003EE6B93A
MGTVLIGAAALVAVILVHALLERQAFRLAALVFDTYQDLKPREATDPPVAVVDIDEASIARLGQWPWSRRIVSDMVTSASALGAAAIGFDIVFSEPDRTAPIRMAEEMRRQGVALDLPASLLPDPDRLLAETINDDPVVIGIALTNEHSSPVPPPKAGFSFLGADPSSRVNEYSGALANLSVLTDAADAMGYFSFPPSSDNIVRSFPLVSRANGHLYPALSVETLRIAQQAGSYIIRTAGTDANPAITDLRVGALDVPVSAGGELWIYYSGMPKMPVISAADLIDPAKRAAIAPLIEGRILLVGTSAVGLRDLVATPLDPAMPGVRVHAEIIDQITSGIFLQRPDWITGAERSATLAAGLIMLAVLWLASPAIGAAAAVVLATLVASGSWIAFSHHLLLFDPLQPLFGIAAILLTTLPLLLMVSHREKRFVRESFGRYLAPALVERLSEHPEALKLGGEDRELTILFSDIRGFTALSETLEPTELTSLLNGFLTPMTDVLLKREATIDKYIGDAIMAFWNAPLDIANHPAKGCQAALDMVAAVDALNRDRGTHLKIGIGLNTGMACVGNLGSDQRFSYSCLGDSVNLASRVEGMTKLYDLPVLVTEEVRLRAEGFVFAEIDLVRVVGRKAPVMLHALIGQVGDPALAVSAALLNRHAGLIAAWRSGDFAAARAALADLAELARQELTPLSGLFCGTHRIYRERLESLPADAPADWDGIYAATRK